MAPSLTAEVGSSSCHLAYTSATNTLTANVGPISLIAQVPQRTCPWQATTTWLQLNELATARKPNLTVSADAKTNGWDVESGMAPDKSNLSARPNPHACCKAASSPATQAFWQPASKYYDRSICNGSGGPHWANAGLVSQFRAPETSSCVAQANMSSQPQSESCPIYQ